LSILHSIQRGTTPAATEALGCRDCGMRVSDPAAPLETVWSSEREILLHGRGPLHIEPRNREVHISLCARCAKRNSRAAELVAEYPTLVRSLGDRWYAEQVFEALLLVPDAIGVDASTLTKGGQRAMRLAIEHLRPIGGTVRWSTLLTPTLRLGVDPDRPPRSRWTHVNEDQLDALYSAWASFLADLTDGPRQVEPPEGNNFRTALRGCLLCGVGTTLATRKTSAVAWGPLRGAEPGTLGGKRRPDMIYGYLCPSCSRAAAQAGPGLGPTAMEKAFFAFLGTTPRERPADDADRYGRTTVQVEGLGAWGVLPTGTAPNPTPWAHVPDLDALADELRRLQP
jgi:hypothetical protein